MQTEEQKAAYFTPKPTAHWMMSEGKVTAAQTLRCETLNVKQHKRILGLQLKQNFKGCTCSSVIARLESQLLPPAHPRAVVFWRKRRNCLAGSERSLVSAPDCRSQVWQGVLITLCNQQDESIGMGISFHKPLFKPEPHNY